ncbi:hypothetical protein B0G84_8183 [Paraburkholderia sp. BL8N3]|nr:hypothetical protein B0G84_8183 [Paraburkholderia sp. BL8N3]
MPNLSLSAPPYRRQRRVPPSVRKPCRYVKHYVPRALYAEIALVNSLMPETLDQLADGWTVLMNQVNRQIGRYPDRLSSELAELIRQTEHVIKPDPFEQEVLQTARRLAQEGNLKMALFRLHEVVQTRLEARRP